MSQTTNTTTITTKFESNRSVNAWTVFQLEQKALESPEYKAAANKSKYCSALYKELYPTKEAKDAYFQQRVASDPVLQAKLLQGAAKAATATTGAKGKRVSARDQFQREWYANLRKELGTEKVGLRPTECAAAWKQVSEEEKAALKARCQARVAPATIA